MFISVFLDAQSFRFRDIHIRFKNSKGSFLLVKLFEVY